MGIDNTTARMRQDTVTRAAFLAHAHAAGTSAAIEAQERAGQEQLLASDLLPTDCDTEAFEAVGFTFGDEAPGDPLFRAATLPAGWTRQGSDHDMWSHLLDGHGRRRVAVFYKAAHYDRRACMYLNGPDAYFRECMDRLVDPIVDDTWATPGAVRAFAATNQAQYAEELLEAQADGDDGEVEYLTARINAFQTLADRFGGEGGAR